MKEIEDAYTEFIASKLTLEDFFKISILCATRYDTDTFNIKPNKLKYDRVILVFRDHPKIRDDYFLGQDFSKIHSKLLQRGHQESQSASRAPRRRFIWVQSVRHMELN